MDFHFETLVDAAMQRLVAVVGTIRYFVAHQSLQSFNKTVQLMKDNNSG